MQRKPLADIFCREVFQKIFYVEKTIRPEKGHYNVFFVQETYLYGENLQNVFGGFLSLRKSPRGLFCLQKIFCAHKISNRCSMKRTIRKGTQKVFYVEIFYVENISKRCSVQKRPSMQRISDLQVENTYRRSFMQGRILEGPLCEEGLEKVFYVQNVGRSSEVFYVE